MDDDGELKEAVLNWRKTFRCIQRFSTAASIVCFANVFTLGPWYLDMLMNGAKRGETRWFGSIAFANFDPHVRCCSFKAGAFARSLWRRLS